MSELLVGIVMLLLLVVVLLVVKSLWRSGDENRDFDLLDDGIRMGNLLFDDLLNRIRHLYFFVLHYRVRPERKYSNKVCWWNEKNFVSIYFGTSISFMTWYGTWKKGKGQ